MSHDLERAAVKYAVDGYRVLPVKPGANAPPLEQGWQRKATDDPVRVEALWHKYPDANPGIATGRGLVVLDCDTQRVDRAAVGGRRGTDPCRARAADPRDQEGRDGEAGARPAHHHWDPQQVPRRQGWLHATGWDERRGDPGRPTRREHHRMPATSQGARGRPDRQELARR